MSEFKDGLFEIQDEGSQLAAFQVKCKPGELVLDFCAGSGGKSLAFSHFLKDSGQIFIHDSREKIIANAKKRFRKAGVNNVQFHHDLGNMKKLKKKMDWIVLDVPCTGTGTYRRNPDLKWKFSEDYLNHITKIQSDIFKEALPYLKKDGKIVYMTCSFLPQENILQAKKFCDIFKMDIVDNEHFQSFPASGEMDAFFAVTLKYL